MKKILYVLQILLKLLLIFAIAFIWLRFFVKPLWLSIIISIGVTFLFEIMHRYFQKRNKTQKNLKLKEKEDADNMFFSLTTDNKYINFFEEMLKTRHAEIITKKSYLIINKENKNIVLYPCFKLEPLTPNTVVEILKNIKQIKVEKIIIACYEYDKQLQVFIKNFNEEILLFDRYECYCLYKEYDFYPEITQQYKKEAKLTFKDLLGFAFNKSRTKGYLVSSIILFITSFFVKLNIYYCVISSLLMLLALISYINPKYNNNKTNEVI